MYNFHSYIIFFFTTLFIFCISAYAQPAKIYITCGDTSQHPGLSLFIKKNKIAYLPIIYGADIDPNDTGYINKEKFVKRIHQLFPNKTDTGICVIDWESVIAEAIERKAKAGISPKKEIDRYISAITLAKKERPKVKWGFYDMHIRDYYNRTAAWKKANEVYLPLYKACDILFPSIYDFYPDSVLGKAAQYAYINDNIQVVLKLAKIAKKPVYAFVWHRFHDSTPEYGLTAMDKLQFQEHMTKILNNKVNGSRVTGIVWWMEDAYWFNVKKERVVNEAASFASFNEYQNVIWSRYVAAIKTAIKNTVQ